MNVNPAVNNSGSSSFAPASFPPDLTPLEIKVRLCERLYGDEIDMDAFRVHLRSPPENKA